MASRRYKRFWMGFRNRYEGFKSLMRECVCAPPHIQRYLFKISGCLLDDLHIDVTPVSFDELNQSGAIQYRSLDRDWWIG